MPGKKGFRSKAQQRYMFMKDPEAAQKMADENKESHHPIKNLPEHVSKKVPHAKKKKHKR
jgi:hypothetical protein